MLSRFVSSLMLSVVAASPAPPRTASHGLARNLTQAECGYLQEIKATEILTLNQWVVVRVLRRALKEWPPQTRGGLLQFPMVFRYYGHNLSPLPTRIPG